MRIKVGIRTFRDAIPGSKVRGVFFIRGSSVQIALNHFSNHFSVVALQGENGTQLAQLWIYSAICSPSLVC